MTKSEHIKWCKDRALKYLDVGDLQNAYASMVSDLSKHKHTEGHIGISLGMAEMTAGRLSTLSGMKHFIEGFY